MARTIPILVFIFLLLILMSNYGCEGCGEVVVEEEEDDDETTSEPIPECQPPPITFKLDTNHENFSFEGDVISVHLVGDFTGWTERKVEMNDGGYGGDEVEGDGVWSLNYLIENDGIYEYMYLINYLTLVSDPEAEVVDEMGAAVFEYNNPCTPDIEIVSPSAFGDVFEDGDVEVEAYYTDGSLGMGIDEDSVTLILNGEEVEVSVDPENNRIYTTISGLEDGKYELLLYASDKAGIRSETGYRLFFVDSVSSPPVAKPGFLRFAEVGKEFVLDGSMSFDEDWLDTLSFEWTPISYPSSSAPTLTDYYETSWNGYRTYSGGVLSPVPEMEPKRTGSRKAFTPEEAGEYTFSLIVSDGNWTSSNSDNRVKIVAIPARGSSWPSLHLDTYEEGGRIVLNVDKYEAEGAPSFHWYQDESNPQILNLTSYIEDGGSLLRLPSSLLDGRYYFYCVISDSEGYSYPEIAYLYKDGSDIRFGNLNDPPEWVLDAVIYEIYPKKFHEGRFSGIYEKFAYLKELGINTLWILGALSSHDHREGTLMKNYYDAEYAYGSFKDLLDFIRVAKEEGFRVVIDVNMNSTSKRHPLFELSKDSTSRFRDWYIWFDESTFNYGYGREQQLEMIPFEIGGRDQPDINLSNPSARRYFFEVFDFWLDPNRDGDFSDGVDGFRISRATGIEHIWLQDLRRYLKEKNPDIFIYFEEWTGIELTEEYFHHQVDSAAIYEFYYAIVSIFTYSLGADILHSSLDKVDRTYNYDYVRNSIFLENHEAPPESTIYVDFGESMQKVAAAFAMALSIPSTPLILYGQELGTTHHLEDMPWDKYESGNELFAFYRDILSIRKDSPAMRRGTYYELSTDNNYLYASGVEYEGERLLFLINTYYTDLSDVEVDLTSEGFISASEECSLMDRLSGDNFEKEEGEESLLFYAEPYEVKLIDVACR